MNKFSYLFILLLVLLIQSTNAQYYYNRAFSFSGAVGDYTVTRPGANLSITGSFTLECWVKPVNVASPSYQILIQKRLGSGSTGYTMYLSTGKVSIRTNTSTRLTGNTTIPNGVWSHVAASYNLTTNVFTVYVNGVADGTATITGAAPAADADSLRMAAGFNSPYAGLMDEIRVWNIARTQSDIQLTMRLPLGESTGPYAGLVAAWRCNALNVGSGIEEINGYTAYLRGSASYVLLGNQPGSFLAYNTGLMCTGAATGTCVTIPNSSFVNPTAAITLECWLYTDNTSTQVIISKGSSANYPYRLLKSSSSTFRVILNGTNFMGSGNYGGIIPTGQWVHLAFTYSSVTGIYVYYMNGVQTQIGVQSVGALNSTSDAMTIGGGPLQVTLNGIVDEVRVSSYVKTHEQIVKGMFVSEDVNNDPNPMGNTIAYNFEGTLADYTHSGPRGTFTGTANGIRFTQVVDNLSEYPAPLDRFDAGYFAAGYSVKYSNMPFGSFPQTISDSILVSESLTINDINVYVGITHVFANNIRATLRNPGNSTSCILYPGATPNLGMHMITIFDDQADSTIGGTLRAPWSPRVKPTNSLSVFNGQNTVGWWKLIVTNIILSTYNNGTLIGWGVQFNNRQTTGLENPVSGIPTRFELYQNYPNPFNPATTIKYDIAKATNVRISIYDVLGREVLILVNEFKKAGYYEVKLDGSSLSTGVYFYKIEAGTYVDTKKMVLVK